jgi:hypothetical protein
MLSPTTVFALFIRAIPGAHPSGAQRTCVQNGIPAILSRSHLSWAKTLTSSLESQIITAAYDHQ